MQKDQASSSANLDNAILRVERYKGEIWGIYFEGIEVREIAHVDPALARFSFVSEATMKGGATL